MANIAPVEPVFEMFSTTLKPKNFNKALSLFNENYKIRTEYSKLFGFWTTDTGDQLTKFVHIWEYESMSHRHEVKMSTATDENYKKKLFEPILPCVHKCDVALLTLSEGCEITRNFERHESAVYLLDQAEVKNVNEIPHLHTNGDGTEILVGRFCSIFGQSKTEYRLWRYTDVNEAARCAKRRAIECPFDGTSTLLVPTEHSPLQ